MRRKKVTIPTSGPFAARTKYQQVEKLALSFPYFPPLPVFFIIYKNTIYTKKCDVQQRLFFTYLYVYVYDNIPKDNNSKFPILSACLGMAWNQDEIFVKKCDMNV